MNIKEAFRYQNYLERLLSRAGTEMNRIANLRRIVKYHARQEANPNAEDVKEVIEERAGKQSIDDILSFASWLVNERHKLAFAIGEAKRSMSIDIDAEIDTNKFLRTFASHVSGMLRLTPEQNGETTTETGRGYLINLEGNQTPYYYTIQTTTTPSYDVLFAKSFLRQANIRADEASIAIESAMINTQVDYTPLFDPNEDFDDAVDIYLAYKAEPETED